MEPQAVQPNGGAPLVVWSKPSASLASIPEETGPRRETNNNTSEVKVHVAREEDRLVDDEVSSASDQEEETTSRRKIPDGGWGWVVVFSSLVISLIADGISYSFGLLYIEFLKYFGESKSVTSWIGSLFLAVPLMSGPVGSALVDRFGCRVMTIVGATISCVGFVMSAFANSIWTLYVTFGIIAGVGLGLCYVTAVVSIAYWFDKKRSLANGIGACGSGLGTFLYAPFTQWLIYEYGWRGSMLILAGTLFNMAVCGALMREPGWINRDPVISSDFPGVDHIRHLIETGQPPGSPVIKQNGNAVLLPQSLINLPTFIKHCEKRGSESGEGAKGLNEVYRAVLEATGGSCSEEGDATPTLGRHRRRTRNPSGTFLKTVSVRRNSVVYRGAMMNVRKRRLKASSCPNILRNSLVTVTNHKQSWREEVVTLCRGMADFSMFGDRHFLLVSVATALVYTYYIVPYFYLAEYMVSEGYSDSEGSSALSVIGITTMFGMVGLGWLGDQEWVSVSKTFSACLLATGLLTIAMPLFMHNYWALMAVAAGFGLFFASVYSFTPPLIVEIIPLDRFTTAYGLSLLCQGIGNLLGPPIAGWLYDVTERWDPSFHFAGVGLIFSSLLVVLIPYTENKRLCSS